MRHSRRAVLAAFIAVCSVLAAPRAAMASERAPLDTAIFAGGCFWGIQSVFQHVKGVVTATSGYAGGWIDRPSYEDVSTGRTGHAEVVRVVFDPAQISFAQLLEVFFSVAHDPTQLNRQGPDVGTQYRSEMFYTSPEQKRSVESYIKQLNTARVFKTPIVTRVSPFKSFFPAEDYHQGYAEKNPREPYILIHDAPKVVNLKKRFAAIYSERLAGY